MAKYTEKQIYRLFAVCIFLATASLIIPRFVPNPDGSFAGASSAILTFLIMLGVTLLFSLYLLIVTIQRYRNLSTLARIAGIAPGLVLIAAMIGLFGLLRF